MFEKKVFDYNGLEVRVTDYANDGILGILDHAVQGSEGGLRFSLRILRHALPHIKIRSGLFHSTRKIRLLEQLVLVSGFQDRGTFGIRRHI